MAYFQLPHDAQLLAEAIFIQRLEIDHVRQVGRRLVRGAARETLGLNVRHGPRRTTDLDHLAGLWKGRQGRCHTCC